MWGDPITIGMAARFVPGKDFASLSSGSSPHCARSGAIAARA